MEASGVGIDRVLYCSAEDAEIDPDAVEIGPRRWMIRFGGRAGIAPVQDRSVERLPRTRPVGERLQADPVVDPDLPVCSG